MATCNPLPEGKTVFLAIYAAVVAGIIFSTLVILSSVYTSSPAASAGDGGNGKPLHLAGTSLFSSSSPPSTSTPPPSPIVTRTPKLQREPSDMFTRAIWDVPVDSKMPDLKSFQLTKEMNPLPYFARFPEADMLTSSDQLRPTTTDDSLEVWQNVTTAYNIGMFHWRPTDAAKRLAKEWKDILLSDDQKWDQAGFNDLVRQLRQIRTALAVASLLNRTLGAGPCSIGRNTVAGGGIVANVVGEVTIDGEGRDPDLGWIVLPLLTLVVILVFFLTVAEGGNGEGVGDELTLG
ncbi:Nucleotide-diphospho-sugar transferase [Musa troglodytarum]|uniref:Nucleotide-diphospho-sugar transferase n=1 Tax=Musa troglodytarum TaxID=320322 RepID=A0A9E7KQD3_9LILI|nr:Nucleotide-diphospho-sugar transferase [Musa troglodytarum]